MNDKDSAGLPPGVAQKADAIVDAIAGGHRRIASIAGATRLPETTVIRVVALLRDDGRIGVKGPDGIEVTLAAP